MRQSILHDIVIFLMIFSSQAVAAQWLVKSIVIENSDTERWVEFSYDNRNLLIRKDIFRGLPSNPEPVGYSVYKYDTYRRPIGITDFELTDAGAVEVFSESTVFDRLSKTVTIITEAGKTVIKSWQVSQSDTVYMVEDIAYYRDGVQCGTQKTVRRNTAHGDIISSQIETEDAVYNYRIEAVDTASREKTIVWSTFDGGVYRDTLTTRLFFDLSGNVVNEIQYVHVADSLMPSLKTMYSYDADNHLISTVIQHWGGVFWINDHRTAYSYTADGVLEAEDLQYAGNRRWLTYRHIDYGYDDHGRRETVSSGIDFWADVSTQPDTYIGLPANFDSHSIYGRYAEFAYIPQNNDTIYDDDSDNPLDAVTVYPNPSHSGLFFLDVGNREFDYRVYSCSGTLIASGQHCALRFIDLRGHAAGIYYAHVIIDAKIFALKLMKT